jgi:hypothetical protein
MLKELKRKLAQADMRHEAAFMIVNERARHVAMERHWRDFLAIRRRVRALDPKHTP